MRKLSAFIVVLALTAAACSSAGSGVIGSVGEFELTEAGLGEYFESETLPIDESLRQAVFALLAREVLLQGMEADFGLELDEDAVDAGFAELIAQMEAAGVTPAEMLQVDNAGEKMLRFNAEIGVLRQQVVGAVILDPEVLEAFFSEPAAYTTVCVRHVLVETVEEAEDVIARLDAEEEFAAVASEVSLDTGTPDGDLGCALAARYVPEFSQASLEGELGSLTGPVQTDFGFHVLIVDERSAPSEDDVKSDPATYLTEADISALWTEWFNDTLQAAEVTLDEKYGFWSAVGIVPPDRPDLVPADE